MLSKLNELFPLQSGEPLFMVSDLRAPCLHPSGRVCSVASVGS